MGVLAFGSVHAQANKLKAVASVTIIQEIAKNVAGDRIDVDALVPTNGDVHSYEPTPADVQKIADTDRRAEITPHFVGALLRVRPYFLFLAVQKFFTISPIITVS